MTKQKLTHRPGKISELSASTQANEDTAPDITFRMKGKRKIYAATDADKKRLVACWNACAEINDLSAIGSCMNALLDVVSSIDIGLQVMPGSATYHHIKEILKRAEWPKE